MGAGPATGRQQRQAQAQACGPRDHDRGQLERRMANHEAPERIAEADGLQMPGHHPGHHPVEGDGQHRTDPRQQAAGVRPQANTDVVEDVVAMNAWTEGLRLASYRFFKYKKTEAEEWQKGLPEAVHMLVHKTERASLQRVIAAAELHAAATIMTRDLVNEPAVHVTPTVLSDTARTIGKQAGVTVKVFGERDIKRLGMGALLAVSAGSDQEAQFIHLKYTPKNKTKKPH